MKTIRIISGSLGSRFIKMPPKKLVRVTREIVRESIFGSIHTQINDKSFLDLFGGSGINGIEAFSRGATEVVINELNSLLCKNIKVNCQNLGADKIKVSCMDAKEFLKVQKQPFDFIFLDPPFENPKLLEEVIEIIFSKKLLSPQGMLIIETNISDLKTKFKILKSSKFGQSFVYFLSFGQNQ